MTFVILVGLPGSGKTYFGKSCDAPFFDDITQNGGVDYLFNNLSDKNDRVILSDYGFIFADTRKNVVNTLQEKFPGCLIQWIVWENNPEQCWINIQHRNDGRNISRAGLVTASNQFTYPKSDINDIVSMLVHKV